MKYTLIEGDCLAALPSIRNVDLTVTSPPYNVGKEYDKYNDIRVYTEYLEWLRRCLGAVYDATADGGRICININDTGRHPYTPLHCDVAAMLREKWLLMGIVIWNKGHSVQGTAWGSWKSPSSPCLRGVNEYIIVACKGDYKLKHKGVSDITGEEFMKWTFELWDMQPETRKNGHPAPFPVELPRRCIKLFSYVGDTVLDPFAGSGTTMAAAQELKRSSVAVELSPDYCTMVRRRCFNRTFLDAEATYEYRKL